MTSSTLIAVPLAVHRTDDVGAALQRAMAAKEQGADVIEWRIDEMADDDGAIAATCRLVHESPLPCIVTCRSAEEGGGFEGTEQTRIAILEALATGAHPPRYIDLEWSAWQRSANLRQKVRLCIAHDAQLRALHTGLILSSHDFTTRPPDLLRRVAEMSAVDESGVLKIVWMPRSVRDNLEALELAAGATKPAIVLCMGEMGLMSRVLAPKYGAFLSFAAIDEGQESAPGQPTLRELIELYRFRQINRATRVYGVIGWPVSHSQSPRWHNERMARARADAVYLPLPVAPGWESFKATMASFLADRMLSFRGASVTIPHKENLLRFVRESGGVVDPLAQRIGAANTLVVEKDGSLRAINTDAPAAVGALLSGMKIPASALRARRIAVLGAGGAARAVAAGCAELGAKVVIFNRTSERAEEVARALHDQPCESGGRTHVVAGRPDSVSCGCFDVFVNCTPVGMTGGPDPTGIPLPDEVTLNEQVTIFDTVYAPEVTPLLSLARERGATAISGSGMFERQAELQAQAWERSATTDRPETSRRTEPRNGAQES